jgi:hypothetical protein
MCYRWLTHNGGEPVQNTTKPVRQGAYGDATDQSIHQLLTASPAGATLRDVIAHLGWACNYSTRERGTYRLSRMIKAGAAEYRYEAVAHCEGAAGRPARVYRAVQPIGVTAKPEPAKVEAKPKPRKPIPLKSLPDNVVEAIEAARGRFDPVEALGQDEFRLGLFTVTGDELFAIVDREPGVLSQVAERYLGAGAGA